MSRLYLIFDAFKRDGPVCLTVLCDFPYDLVANPRHDPREQNVSRWKRKSTVHAAFIFKFRRTFIAVAIVGRSNSIGDR